MNPLRELYNQGQSFWLDYISRGLITTGQLQRLVEADGLRGLTSNPTIFHKAITGSGDYDLAIRRMLAEFPDIDEQRVYERLAVEDIRTAADILRPVYDASEGRDGFVSMEISPHLARDTAATLSAAQHHWRAVERPNLMVKVPATPEGIPAIEELTAQGINVNVTLMFSMRHYEAVAQAYLRGVRRARHSELISSVASFFVSRVDTLVDKRLSDIGTPRAMALRGKAAIANARLAYRRFQEIFRAEQSAPLAHAGVAVQRLLWGSTSVKNPAYRDVMYVEELIGPQTINTMPLETAMAFKDHGRVAARLMEDVPVAQRMVRELKELDVDLDQVGDELQREGVASFASSHDQLLTALRKKCAVIEK